MAGRGNAKELDEGQEGEEVPVKKSSKVKMIVILLTILMMMGGAGAGGWYWWFNIRVPAGAVVDAESGETVEGGETVSAGDEGDSSTPRISRLSDLPRSAGIVLPLPDLVVNLSDPTGKKNLRLGMEVEATSDISGQIAANSAKIRDAIIMLLAGKTLEDVSSVEGKITLKTEVGARLNQILGAQKVIRIYFTEFVVE